jgi:hypothetical protein
MKKVTLFERDYDNLLDSFWYLLGEAESKAMNDDDILLKHQVECFYRQYNELTGAECKPRWIKE